MATTLATRLVVDALNMALATRRPKGVIHHSDQGSRFSALIMFRHHSENQRERFQCRRRTVEQTRVIEIGTLRRVGYVGKPARDWWKWRYTANVPGRPVYPRQRAKLDSCRR
jgi:transposase InsO family protein